MARLLLTTSHKASVETVKRARDYATRWGLPFQERTGRAVSELEAIALVVTNESEYLATESGPLWFHLGTAFIRLQSLRRGDGDALITAGLRAGDHVLDTTFGLGRDARVAAAIVGPTGSVTALEASEGLFHLAHMGLQHTAQQSNAGPLSLHHGNSLEFLHAAEPASVDAILIDPMFDKPGTSDPGFAVMRALADPMPLTPEWVHQARRVARRLVVVKAGRSQPWFGDEGLEWVPGNSKAGWYRASASAV